jgi:AcrR family transcriptional regulator
MTAAAAPSRFESKRRLILDEATRLFKARGLKGATLIDVARSIGLSNTSVSYYFPRRDDLAAACFFQTIAAYDALLDAVEPVEAGEARIRAFIDLHFEQLARMARGEAPDLIGFSDLSALSGPQADAVFEAFVGLFRRTRTVLTAPAAPDETRPGQNARTHLLLSVVFGAAHWARDHEPGDLPRIAARTADILLNGLPAADAVWPPEPLAFDPLPHDRAGEAREAFLRATTRLLNEKGYHGASVSQISARLGVTKGSFYHHLDTKEDLVSGCFERSFLIVRCAQDAGFALEASGWERLSRTVAALVRYQLSEHGPLLRYTALSAAPEGVRQDLAAVTRRLGDRFGQMVADGVIDGSIRGVDQGLAARMLDDMINAAAELWRWTPELDADRAVAEYARPMMFGLISGRRGLAETPV